MDTDQQQLQKFLDDVQRHLSEVFGAQIHLIRPDMRPFFTAAWIEVEPMFPEVRRSVGALTLERLRAMGLSGAQLKLKLEGFRRAITALSAGGWRSGLVKKVLKWVNIILGSVLAGVPGAEPLKELKEALEAELEE